MGRVISGGGLPMKAEASIGAGLSNKEWRGLHNSCKFSWQKKSWETMVPPKSRISRTKYILFNELPS